jgi:hypothetical protein
MKKVLTVLNDRIDRLHQRWQALSVKKQHRYMLLLFLGYTLLTILVILKAGYELVNPDNDLSIEHIENPVIKQSKSPDSPRDSINNPKK